MRARVILLAAAYLHILRKAHIQHLIGLIQRGEENLGQHQDALLRQVLDATGRADDRVRARAQCRA